MSEIIGNVIEKLPVSPVEAPKQGVSPIEQSTIETFENEPLDEINKSVMPSGIVKESAPVVKEDTEWDGYGYEPVIPNENDRTSGGIAMEIVLQKRNRVPVSYIG